MTISISHPPEALSAPSVRTTEGRVDRHLNRSYYEEVLIVRVQCGPDEALVAVVRGTLGT